MPGTLTPDCVGTYRGGGGGTWPIMLPMPLGPCIGGDIGGGGGGMAPKPREGSFEEPWRWLFGYMAAVTATEEASSVSYVVGHQCCGCSLRRRRGCCREQ